MIENYRGILIKALKLFDLVILLFSLVLAVTITLPIHLDSFLALRVSVLDLLLFGVFLGLWHWTLCCHKLYVSRRLSSFLAEATDIVKAITFGTVILYLFAVTLEVSGVAGAFLFFFWVNATLLTLLGRRVIRLVLRQLRAKGMNLRKIVIAGAHHRALQFAQEILSKPELGYRVVGFVDDAGETCAEAEASGFGMVATFDTFNDYLRKEDVDEVAICLPLNSHYQQAAHVASICEEHGIMVRFISDIFNPKMAHAMTQQFEGHSIITFYTGNMRGGGVVVKRLLDVVLSFLLMVVLAPIFLVTALLVKITSAGPVFFVQKRLGLNKHHFQVYKFRTMYQDAESRQAELEHLNEVQGAAFKIRNDPRVTPLGRILRRTSIDELPQLLNVLKGEMSLVGPRPLPIRDYASFDKDWHRRRFSVRPGITCLWQISGRSNVSFEKWMELDMEYIDHWSLWLDLKILFCTVSAVLRRDGAV